MTDQEREDLRRRIYTAAEKFEVYSPDAYKFDDQVDVLIHRKRRLGADEDDPRLSMTLTEVDGVLRWEPGYGYAGAGRGRRSRRGRVVSGEVVAPLNFRRLEPAQLGEYLISLDRHFNPDCDLGNPANCLRQLVAGRNGPRWGPLGAKPVKEGRILLFIHGTFSKNEPYLSQLTQTKAGKDLLKRALNRKNYAQVLGFEHPTVAVGPWLNALDLGRLFENSSADIDVIAHSRGGLVTRWWLETQDRRKSGSARAVLVGSPLGGTSLASPPRLRAAIDLLTNVASVVETGSHLAAGVFPFLEVVAGLLKVVGSMGTLVAKTPVIDAAVAMIPGLAAQAKTSNNAELNRLNHPSRFSGEYYAVTSNFEPPPVGWEFWKYFSQIGPLLKDAAADLVFDQPNDLVVDTASMTTLAFEANGPKFRKVWQFDKTEGVYHTIYFAREETAEFITKVFELK